MLFRLIERLYDELITASANKLPLEKEEMLDSVRYFFHKILQIIFLNPTNTAFSNSQGIF